MAVAGPCPCFVDPCSRSSPLFGACFSRCTAAHFAKACSSQHGQGMLLIANLWQWKQRFKTGDAPAPNYISASRIAVPTWLASGAISTPALSSTLILSAAVPEPCVASAPASHLRRSGGACSPAIRATTGFFGLRCGFGNRPRRDR